MRRSTRAARKRDDDGDGDDAGAGNNKRARASLPPAKAAPVNSNKKSKRTAAVKRASPSDPPSSASDDGDCDADSGNDVPVTGIAPEWVHSLFSKEQRAQWDDFLRTKCLVRVGDDFYDLFELACAISKEHPLGTNIFVGGAQSIIAKDDVALRANWFYCRCVYRLAGYSPVRII